MDLTQLANLGEFIGGVAVLVTLIYLAVQVRQSAQAQEHANRLARARAVGEENQGYSSWRNPCAERREFCLTPRTHARAPSVPFRSPRR